MRFSNLLSSATLALTANALLLPLNTPKNVDLTNGIPGTEKQTLNLDCPDCPIALESDSIVPQQWKTTEKPSSKLVLDFAVEGQQVMVNGVPIYPPGPRSGVGLRAKQTTSDKDIKTYQQGIPLSTSVDVQGVRAIAGNDGVMKVYSISIDIIGLASHVVRMDTVRVQIADGVGNKPMLLPIETTPYQSSPAQDSCTNVFCRFRAIIIAKVSALRAAAAARLNKFRGCGRPGSAIKDNGSTMILPGHRRPHLQGLTTQNAAHHRFRHALRRFIRVVILPIFFGITSGLVIGAFSMLVWTAVASVARRMSGKKPSYEELAQVEEGERASVEVEGEGPPKYEDVYTEPEEDVVDEKRQLL